MAENNLFQLSPLAEFHPSSHSRSWASVPNPGLQPLIVTASADKTARVYSLVDFTLHSILEGGHSRSVRSVAWKPVINEDAPLTLATGSFDATLGIWRHIKEKCNDEKQDQDIILKDFTHANLAESVHLQNGSAETDDEPDWEFSIVLEGHDSEIKHVAYSPSGQFLASCSRDKSIWIWEEIGAEGEADFETVAVLQDHTADVKCISWRKDDGKGEMLASASYDDTIRFWRDVDNEGEWECTGTLVGHEATVWALEWEPDVSISLTHATSEEQEQKYTPRLMSASADGTIRVWSPIATSPTPTRPSYHDVYIPSTMRPAPAMEKWEVTATLPKAHQMPIYSISWSKKTGRVTSSGCDGKIVVYEERTKGRGVENSGSEREWVIICSLDNSHGPYEVNHVTWCGRWDDGQNGENEMIVSTADDGSIRAWTLDEIAA
ncbi:BgTH12-00593 [Blumeria graminis f. sp. triticale]|uniref:Probable cytosolic iron-sulfur protein assembly protein 1 n=4 Tax=Blumeria graminis TaxID=34373 RepID=A0A656KFU7_BLUGR|nr:hypothetical protein BGT96224_3443 [Blumeria graminis f. sp. tritici 96224]CAD6505095.1 BgTH12-00593 [Blumeria graminis f. sp. triticale]VDB93100.1 Bgt-3443 [Blumeria graminis f. sp. tritici]